MQTNLQKHPPQIHSHLWDTLLFLLHGLRFLKYTHLKQAFKSEEVNTTVTSPPTADNLLLLKPTAPSTQPQFPSDP